MKFIRVLKSSLPNENSLGEPISNNSQVLQNFWNWFKGSKVVDEQGRPLVVYHGTKYKFDTFKQSETGALGQGMYFVSSEEFAKGIGKIIIPTYLNIRNPYIIEYPVSGDSKKFTDTLKNKGYDGVIHYANGFYVAFEPNQIKSISNNTNYNQEDNSIYGGLK